ncbi:cation efflux pump [gut metagenome]|uniref:Cation efflux pump n=1 Tax=gut metagenome TaxID=749906 RepID=J9FN81_9ZZZZ
MGDTLVPSVINLVSMWVVRIGLALILVPQMGLKGLWTAMCIELCFRGMVYLFRFYRRRWLH